jgi:hypothetical protein
MKLDKLVKLGEEMGRTLTAKPYEEFKRWLDTIPDGEGKDMAKQTFYQSAEMSHMLTNAKKAEKVANVSHKK